MHRLLQNAHARRVGVRRFEHKRLRLLRGQEARESVPRRVSHKNRCNRALGVELGGFRHARVGAIQRVQQLADARKQGGADALVAEEDVRAEAGQLYRQ
mgnify:CR=1 FL=1